jgi:putative ABC transport system ATP-binding protein
MPSLTALENILAPMEIRGLRNAQDRAQRLLEDVDLVARAHHYPSQLSGGEQQRVAIARAFANDPSILLADEPTGNLDSRNGRHVFEMMVEMNRKRNATLVLVTHDHELAALADRQISLRDGHVASDSSAIDLTPELEDRELEDRSMEALS